MAETLKLNALKLGLSAAAAVVVLSLIAVALHTMMPGTMQGYGMPGYGMMGSTWTPPAGVGPGEMPGFGAHMTGGFGLMMAAMHAVVVGIAAWLTAVIYNRLT